MALSAKNRLSLRGRSLKGTKVADDNFILISEAKKGIFKSAVVISKKVAAKAVDRNRIRRLITEAIRNNVDEIKFEGELALIVKKNISNLKVTEVEEKILKLIKKI